MIFDVSDAEAKRVAAASPTRWLSTKCR